MKNKKLTIEDLMVIVEEFKKNKSVSNFSSLKVYHLRILNGGLAPGFVNVFNGNVFLSSEGMNKLHTLDNEELKNFINSLPKFNFNPDNIEMMLPFNNNVSFAISKSSTSLTFTSPGV